MSQGSAPTHKPQNRSQHLHRSWPVLDISSPLPFPHLPSERVSPETPGGRKPPPGRALGAVPRCGSLCRENFSRKLAALDKERAAEGVCQPMGYAERCWVPGRTRLPSSASLGWEWPAPAASQSPPGAGRRQAGEATVGSWTSEWTGVGGGEQRRGAKLSNCARSPTQGGEREGKEGEGRGREGAGGSRGGELARRA